MIADILHKIAAMDQEEHGDYYPRPSLAGPERCGRSMVYWGLGFKPEPFSGRALVVFDDGIWHEELTKEWIRKSTYQVHSEQMKVNCLPPLTTGNIDFILTDLSGTDIHVEHKAINHFTFQRFESLKEWPLDYLTQTAIYNEAIQRELNPALRTSLLLVKNKNTGAYLEYQCYYNKFDDNLKIEKVVTSENGELRFSPLELPLIVSNARNKFFEVQSFIERKTLPKRPYDIDHWRCQYCQFGAECWKDYDKEFLELKTNSILPQEVADAVRYYKELGGQKKDIESEYEKLRDKIKAIMKECNAREGVAGEYICRLKLKGKSEQLYISKLKGE